MPHPTSSFKSFQCDTRRNRGIADVAEELLHRGQACCVVWRASKSSGEPPLTLRELARALSTKATAPPSGAQCL